MTRPIWDGEITFGLINIPVQLFAAERTNELSFHLLDASDENRIRNERVNEVTGKPVPWKRIVKGYEMEPGQYVVLTPEDFTAADMHGSHTIDLQGFVDTDAIDPIYFKKPYYLIPGKHGEKGYRLLLETLKRAEKGGLAKFVLRTREYLGLLLPWHDTLTLMLLRFDEDIVAKDELADTSKEAKTPHRPQVSDKEIAMAKNLVEAMTIDWEPSEYHDEYKAKLLAWINKKAHSRHPLKMPSKPPTPAHGKVVSMLDLLQRSVDRQAPTGKAARAKPKTARSKPSHRATRASPRRRTAHAAGT